MSTSWLSLVFAVLQLILLSARWLERAKIISEADAAATARLISAAKEAADAITNQMDAAARRATPPAGVPVNDDPYERD
jgi:hypothetical protein